MGYLNRKWYFPNGKNLEKVSAANAAVETFNDHKIESLAREIVQNSLDASNSNKPVLVEFNLFSIKQAEVPGSQEFQQEIIPLAQQTWAGDLKTKNLLKRMADTLDQPIVNVLKISDYQTTGLNPKNWQSLIEQTGSSVKENDNSGGSFGIGKGAPFAVSDLRMVFYNTKTNDIAAQSIGVSKFVSFDLADGNTTQGTGYYGANENVPFEEDVIFDPKRRTENGTDVYVMGFNITDFPNWQEQIILSILDNFLVAIFDQELHVKVGNQMISKRTLPKLIEHVKANKELASKYVDLISYYQVLTDPNHLVIKMPGFAEIPLAKNEAVLILSNQTLNNRKVLMTRKMGMKIFNRDHISAILQFSGVFHATGVELNGYLKSLENPNHDKWSVDRAQDLKKAKSLLDDIYQFIETEVVKNFAEKATEEVDAFGINNFLPNDLDKLKNDDAVKSNHRDLEVRSLVSQHLNATPRRNDINRSVEKEELLIAQLLEENTQAPEKIVVKKTMHQAPTNKKQRIDDFVYRVLGQNPAGNYQLFIQPQEDLANFTVNLYYVGDDNGHEKVDVVTSGTGEINDGVITVSSLKQNEVLNTEITINQSKELKLEVEIYANSK